MLDKIEPGTRFKNYKSLCNAFGIKPQTGYSKTKQLKWIQQHIAYKKSGHAFIVEEVLENKIQPIQDNRGGVRNTVEYRKLIEQLILDMIILSDEAYLLFLSKSELLKSLSLVNQNYSFGKMFMREMDIFTNATKGTTSDWYASVDSMLENQVRSALNNLQSQRFIFWSRSVAVNINEVDNSGKFPVTITRTREAEEWEAKEILDTEKEVIERMGFTSLGHIMYCNKWNEFRKNVANKLKGLTCLENMNYYYHSYKIVFTKRFIKKRLAELEPILTEKDRDKIKEELNKSVQDRILSNAINRQENYLENNKIIGVDNTKHACRRSESYIRDIETINNYLIDLSSHIITSDLGRIRKEQVKKKLPTTTR